MDLQDQAEFLGILGTSISFLSTKSQQDAMTSDFLSYVRTLKGGGAKSGFPEVSCVSVSVGVTTIQEKGV
jgi:hypothetical protein